MAGHAAYRRAVHTRGLRQSVGVTIGALLAACSGGGSSPASTASAPSTSAVPASADLPSPLQDLLATAADWQWFTQGDDTFEVWVCHVPLNSTASIYRGMQLRLPLTPTDVTEVFTRQVTPYFDTLSHGQYHPVFKAGGEVEMGAADLPQDCLNEAIAGAGDDTNAVFAVADAEHGGSDPGGFGSTGDACAVASSCSVEVSERAAYIGASDFHPDWGELKPMDLAEHEVGHTLGWMHSAVERTGEYLSALDVMSNSAAPRDVDEARRDGPDTLALNRLLAGWLPASSVWSAPDDGGTIALAPSMSMAGMRLVVLAVDDSQFLTIELLTADGFNDHLPADGIAIHRVDVRDGVVQNSAPLVGETPYADLLEVGGEIEADGWRITVDAGIGAGPAATWTVSVRKA